MSQSGRHEPGLRSWACARSTRGVLGFRRAHKGHGRLWISKARRGFPAGRRKWRIGPFVPAWVQFRQDSDGCRAAAPCRHSALRRQAVPPPRSPAGVRSGLEFATRIGALVVDDAAHRTADLSVQRAAARLRVIGTPHACDRRIQFIVQTFRHEAAPRRAIRRMEIDPETRAARAACRTGFAHVLHPAGSTQR